MAAAKTFYQRVDIFERFLSEIARGSRKIPKTHQSLIRKTYGESTLHFGFTNHKAIRNEFSDRHVRRLITQYVGISPKLLMRIVRYQKTLRSINASPNQSMAALSAEQGYFDQPHFIREFRRFQGLTPSEFVQRLISKGNSHEP